MISQKFPMSLRGNGKGPGEHGNDRDDRVGNNIRLNLSSGGREAKAAAGTTVGTRRLKLEQSVPGMLGGGQSLTIWHWAFQAQGQKWLPSSPASRY